MTTESCSQCGWAFDTEALQQNRCRKCKSARLVTSVAYLEKFERPAIQKYIAQYSNSLKNAPTDSEALLAIGICYLKLGLYDLAMGFLARLVEAHPADPQGYYYRAICLFRGKRPRKANRRTAQEAESLVETAIQLDPANGRYDALLATIRDEYYVRNGMRSPPPSPDELLAQARAKHLDAAEIRESHRLVGVAAPPLV